MTGDEFRSQYQLLRRVTTGDVRTFHAVGPRGGVVMVHVVQDARVKEDLAARIEQLGEADRARVLDSFDVEGSPVIVTRFILDFETLQAWLETRLRATAGGQPAAETVPPDQPAAPAGPELGPPPSGAGSDPDRSPDTTERPERRPPPDAPSSFTAAFAGLGDTQPLQQIPAEPSAEEAADEPSPEGDVEAESASDPVSEPPEGDAADSGDEPPGEFTQLFQALQPEEKGRDPSPAEAGATAPPDRVGEDLPTLLGADAITEPGDATPPPGETAASPPADAGEDPRPERALGSAAADRSEDDTEDDEPGWMSIGDPVGVEEPGQKSPGVGGEEPEEKPSEFTKLFEAMAPDAPEGHLPEPDSTAAPSSEPEEAPPEARRTPAPPQPPSESEALPPHPAASQGPGFDDVFGTDEKDEPPPSVRPPPSEGMQDPVRPTGERGSEPTAPQEPPAPPPSIDPGMASPADPAPPPSPDPGTAPPADLPPPPSEPRTPGPLTRQFALPEQPDEPGSPPLAGPRTPPPSFGTGSGADDYLSRLESTGGSTSPRGAAPPPDAPPPPDATTPATPPSQRSGPGEYTRIVQAIPAQEPPPPPGEPPPSDAPAKGPSRRLIIGVVVGAVVLTLLTVVTAIVWTLVGPLLRSQVSGDAPADGETDEAAEGESEEEGPGS